MSVTVHLRPASSSDVPGLIAFLKANSLPTVGVESCYENFVIATDEKGKWIGVAGLEVYNQNALLRSVAVREEYRGFGHGGVLVDEVLKNAKREGVRVVYLLSETADGYFRRLGFDLVDRNDVDESVKASQEFTECCKTAKVMRKSI